MEEEFEEFSPKDTDCEPQGHHDVQQQFEDALRTPKELQEMIRDSENMSNDDLYA